MCSSGENKAQHTYCLTSKEDHTYVRREIYQRVIAIRKSKKDPYITATTGDFNKMCVERKQFLTYICTSLIM
jgi:hypothetical protein